MDFPKTIQLECVKRCGRHLRIPFRQTTEQFTRTCRKCGTRQRILSKPTPLHVKGKLAGFVHMNTSTRLADNLKFV